MVEGEGAPPSGGGAPPPTEPPLLAQYTVPETYAFAKIKTKDGDKEVETDVPEATAKEISDFAKANKMSLEHAQAILNRELARPKPEGAPDTYTFAKVKAKDDKGAEVEADVAKEITDPIAAFAKENNLTQPQAQKLLDREIALTQAAETELQRQDQQMRTQWREDAKKDPLLSADGKFDENLGVAKTALEKFFPGIAKEMNNHPFLDHPIILRGLLDIGKKISVDGTIVVPGKETTPNDALDKLYPTMKKKA